jgi:hypothetical protein
MVSPINRLHQIYYEHSFALSVKHAHAGRFKAAYHVKDLCMTRYLVLPKGGIQGPYDLFAAARPVWQFVKNVAQRMENRRAVAQLLE